MSAELIIGILATGWLATIGWGIAWMITVPAMKSDLKALKEAINEMKLKIHDTPCQANLIFQGEIGRTVADHEARIKGLEHHEGEHQNS